MKTDAHNAETCLFLQLDYYFFHIYSSSDYLQLMEDWNINFLVKLFVFVGNFSYLTFGIIRSFKAHFWVRHMYIKYARVSNQIIFTVQWIIDIRYLKSSHSAKELLNCYLLASKLQWCFLLWLPVLEHT